MVKAASIISPRKCLFFWLLLLVLSTSMGFLLLLPTIPNKKSLKIQQNAVGQNQNVLFRTAIFPRGGDRMVFDQPWPLAQLRNFASMEALLQQMEQAKFVTSDFSYSPGLGNLMFQFAALRALAAREDAFLVLPVGCMLRRAFRLDAKVILVEDRELREFIATNAHLVKHCCKFDDRFEQTVFDNNQRVAIVNGYFQSFRYFHPNHTKLVRQSFQFLPEISRRARATLAQFANKTSTTNFVGVHVRHGMDLTLHQRNQRHGHVVAPASFFSNAMYELGKEDGGNVQFVVASDDMAWVRRNIAGISEFRSERRNASRVHLLQGHTREVDLAILMQCNNSIVSTGTFGWWSAFLGWHPTRKVLYYGGWPKPGSPLENMVHKADYFLPEWIPINA